MQKRINDPAAIDADYIAKELRAGNHVIVQFSDISYDDKKLSGLNELCKQFDQNFGVRFYGHYGGAFDAKTLLKIPSVKCLYIDCLMRAIHLPALTELPSLQKLILGIFELKETEILKADNLKQLSELIISETRTKALNLDYLKDYHQLRQLIIGGHQKNIEAVGEIRSLELLSLNSIRNSRLHFINKLKKLKTLKLVMGGRENINEITENEIENLEISWVRGFNDLSNISNFRKLKNLLIEDELQLREINFKSVLAWLDTLKIMNCKTLTSLTGLEHLTALQQLRIYQTRLDFDCIIRKKLPASLKIFSFCTTKKKLDAKIKGILEQQGYTESSR